MKFVLAIISIVIIIRGLSYAIYMFKRKKYPAFFISLCFIISILALGIIYYI